MPYPTVSQCFRAYLADAQAKGASPAQVDAWAARTGRELAAVLAATLRPDVAGSAGLALAEGLVGAKLGQAPAQATPHASTPATVDLGNLPDLFDDDDDDGLDGDDFDGIG